MALSDCFPYGAPEQLEGASARMARSTMTSTLAVTFLIVAAGAMMPRAVLMNGVSLRCAPPPHDVFEHVNILPPPPKTGPPVPPIDIVRPDATPVPVPDEFERTSDIVEPTDFPSGPIGEPSDSRSKDPSGSGGSIAPPRDPEWNEFVPVDEMPALVHCKEAIYPDLPRL